VSSEVVPLRFVNPSIVESSLMRNLATAARFDRKGSEAEVIEDEMDSNVFFSHRSTDIHPQVRRGL